MATAQSMRSVHVRGRVVHHVGNVVYLYRGDDVRAWSAQTPRPAAQPRRVWDSLPSLTRRSVHPFHRDFE